MNRADALVRAYHLEPHPEGGAFAEVYTSPFFGADGRSMAGSIYFLLNRADISHLHQIDCDEIWYFHEGCGMRVTVIHETGAVERIDLGPDPDAGQRFMAAIPAGAIFAAENLDKSGYCFVSCATTPKFTYKAFRLVSMDEINALCPEGAGSLSYLVMP